MNYPGTDPGVSMEFIIYTRRVVVLNDNDKQNADNKAIYQKADIRYPGLFLKISQLHRRVAYPYTVLSFF